KRVFLVILFTSFSGSLVSRIPGAVQVGIGHSSLTRKGIELKEQNRMYIKERARIANRFNRKGGCYAIDVYLAGEILFNDFGQIVNWNNNSGHYKISKEVSMVNIPAPVKHILPIELFTSYNIN
ncbi:hypothetical protein, partial [Escherichia sp. MOD1-EC2449]|uniref:hypothetical protein n=2 Tax=unclassified Escherichia TaxID=2608889 RepID=UPI001A7E1BBA